MSDETLHISLARFEECYRRIGEAGGSVNENYRRYMILKCLSDDYDYLAGDFEKRDKNNFTYEL